MSKADIVREGIKYKVDFSKTWTCYEGGELPSASTASSSLRLQGFIEAGYRDPVRYEEQDRLDTIYKEKGIGRIL